MSTIRPTIGGPILGEARLKKIQLGEIARLCVARCSSPVCENAERL